VSRLFSGTSPVSLTTVGIIILVLLVLDVIFTLGFAAFVASGAGRSAREDYDIPFLGAAANHLYSRSAHTNTQRLWWKRQLYSGGGSANCTAVVDAPTVRRWFSMDPSSFFIKFSNLVTLTAKVCEQCMRFHLSTKNLYSSSFLEKNPFYITTLDVLYINFMRYINLQLSIMR
jgi:hypothetical protein